MSAHPTNPALEAAIVAHADEDTPRLAYADWLDEHGDPDRAEFIRVQCRLAETPPGDPDWVDLTERQDELVARLKSRLLTDIDDEPDRFYTGTDVLDRYEERFRRGFPYFTHCQTSGAEWTPEETARVAADLTRLVRTTTFRGFHPYSIPVDALAELLASPVTAELTGLALMPHPRTRSWQTESAAYYRLVARGTTLRRVKHLSLYGGYGGTPPAAVAELATATALDSVRRLTLQDLQAPAAALNRLTKAAWFRRLRHFRCNLDAGAVAVPMIAGLGRLPDLHTLDLVELAVAAVPALAAGKFPALARLDYGGPLGLKHARALAGAKFPALTVFAGAGGAKNDSVSALLKAKWFARLRVLDLADNAIGDGGVKALAAHPVAKTLRVLRLGNNAFGRGGLAALAADGAFPELTTLSLHSHHTRRAKPADLAAFLTALRLPRLRHLDLGMWPLGNAGAKALAQNPALAGLTRLNVEGCGIGDAGARAIFASPHLRGLVELQMNYNAVKAGAGALADPAVMPRLGECWLSGNKIPRKAAERLDRAGLYLIT
jgi:uncharacterized protein (TIGR02996 family)